MLGLPEWWSIAGAIASSITGIVAFAILILHVRKNQLEIKKASLEIYKARLEIAKISAELKRTDYDFEKARLEVEALRRSTDEAKKIIVKPNPEDIPLFHRPPQAKATVDKQDRAIFLDFFWSPLPGIQILPIFPLMVGLLLNVLILIAVCWILLSR
jgi:hypothetical protein